MIEKVILKDGTILGRKDTYYVDKGEYREGYGGTDWDNPKKRAEIGAKPFQEVKDFSEIYYEEDGYSNVEKDGVITRIYNKKPKETLKQVQSWKKHEQRNILEKRLQQTDREILNYLEKGEEIPEDLQLSRQSSRDECETKCSQIDNTTDYDNLVEGILNGDNKST